MSTISLSQLPQPEVIETLDYEAILAERKAYLISLYPADQQAAVAATLALESEPITKLLQENAYRELIVRQRVNEASLAVMLAYAMGTDLDQIGANANVFRLLITPGNPDAIPPLLPVYESDTDFRVRIQLAPEGYTTAGSHNSYLFHGLSAAGDVRDVDAISPTPGQVTVYVLSRSGDGTASPELLAAVTQALNDDHVRTLTDRVVVQSAQIIPYTVAAELLVPPGPDAAVVLQGAIDAITAYTEQQRQIGVDVTLSGIYAALHQPGVHRVDLTAPLSNLVIGDGQASYCTAITVTLSGVTHV